MKFFKTITALRKLLRNLIIVGFTMLFLVFILIPIPDSNLDYSTVIYDRSGQILSARIASDEQWRFPIEQDLPENLEQAIIYFEDEYFYYHPGFNPVSLLKAIYINAKSKRVVRGGSTITMQLMRMYYGNRTRTYSQKAMELIASLKLELLYSKKEILKMWATMAPFGGNTVGASTASWRYFSRDLNQLSWAEYALLAVLPNAPAALHMSRNTDRLKVKRDRLLRKLNSKGLIDSTELSLAIQEEIAFQQTDLPQNSLHFLNFLKNKFPEKQTFHTTIDPVLQKILSDILEEYSEVYQFDGIQNAAATIIDIHQNEVLAYIGNTKLKGTQMRFVDCVQAPRSYGSLLKPFLYAFALDKGYFLPHECIKDIPSNFNGFIPKNFDRKFRGVIPMDQMVSKSLNVPAVRILNYVGMESFHYLLKKDLRLSFINSNPNYHGLSVILGGAESNIWEMSKIYKGLVRNYHQYPNAYNEIKCLQDENEEDHTFSYHPNAAWHTLNAMQSVNRPEEEQNYSKLGGQSVAWKTGTSYGHRDAWAIGCNDRHVVSVWVGNESGKGVYNLTGAIKAGPILFRIMRHLDAPNDIKENISGSEKVQVCSQSGKLKGPLCTKSKDLYIPFHSHDLRQCAQHDIVRTRTETSHEDYDTLYFLPPVENYYSIQFNGKDFSLSSSSKSLNVPASVDIVYPENNAILTVPKKLKNEYSEVQLKANSSDSEVTLFWFLNGEFVQKTQTPHHVHVNLEEGEYALLVNDTEGNKDALEFKVIRSN